MRQESVLNKDLSDHAADHLLSLVPLYHLTVFRRLHGITGMQAAQFRVLHHLMHHGVRQMSGIGRQLCISKPYMTTLVDAMIEEGFVERQPDPEDRRVIRILITPKGRSHLATRTALLKDDLKRRIETLSTADLELLVDSLQDLQCVLSKIGED